MFFHLMKLSKKFLIVIMTGIIGIGLLNASEIEGLKEYVETNQSFVIRKLPTMSNEQARSQVIMQIFSNPNVSLFDLSNSDIGDSDIEDIFKGLCNRQKYNPISIKLLDVSQKTNADDEKNVITKDGLKKLLSLFQSGYLENKRSGKNEFPTLHETIIKVSHNLIFTRELFEEYSAAAPHVFVDGLSIVE